MISRRIARNWVKAVALTGCSIGGCHPTLVLEGDVLGERGGSSGAPGWGGQSSVTLEVAGGAANTTEPSNTAGVGGQSSSTTLANAGAAGAVSATPPASSKRRHVILLIGDGMQLSAEIATSRYLHGVDFGLSFHSFPVKAYQTTWSIDVYDGRAAALGAAPYAPGSFDPSIGYDPSIGGEAPYPILEDNATRLAYFSFSDWIRPDSASTTTAISTGAKTRNGMVAWNEATDQPLQASTERLRRLYGMSIGLATTIPFSHSRSAGFFAHNPSRENLTDIAREILTVTRPEVIISSGWNSNYYDPADLTQALASGDTVFNHDEPEVESNTSMLAAAAATSQTNRSFLAIYGAPDGLNVPIAVNSLRNPLFDLSRLDRPSLPNSTLAALELLARDPDGFLLVVEQGQIDWATNAHDYSAMIGCVSELDQAARIVSNFVDQPGDSIDWSNTTFIVTAGHSNGYLRFGKTLQQGELPLQVPSDTGLNQFPNLEVIFNNSGTDTSELVAVYAKGFAANKLSDYATPYPGLPIIDNTALYWLTLDAAQR